MRETARNFLWLNYYCAKKTKAIPSHSVISTETNEVSEAEKSQNKNTLFKRFFDFACGSAQNDRRWSLSYELLCNAMSDERGKPRVMSCLRQRCGLRRHHGFREASKTRRTPYQHTPANQPLEMRAVQEVREKPDGVYFGVNDRRLPQRDKVMRRIYKGKRRTTFYLSYKNKNAATRP